MKTTIAIPCVDRHLNKLDRLLSHIIKGTILPDEVVVAVFPIVKKEQHDMISKLSDKFGKSFDLRFIKSTDQMARQTARNFLIPYLQGDLILWHDADDTQHPQRVEIVKQFFDTYDIVHFCHSYRKGKEKEIGNIVFNNIKCFNSELVLRRYNKQILNYDAIDWTTFAFGGGIVKTHAGACCIRKEVLEKIKFAREYPGEDAKFCFDILKTFKKTLLTDAKLYNYNII